MKVGVTSLTFKKEEIKTVFEYAKKANIEGIEWGVCDNHIILCDEERTSLVKKLSKEYDIEIFSLASYCNMTDFEECKKAVETAQMLTAPIIRIWAGHKGSDICDDEYFNIVVENSKKMADIAAKLNIMLCFEYHQNTLTDTADSAIRLIKAIDKENVRLYWQALPTVSHEENCAAIRKVVPYVYKHIHLENYSKEKGHGLLSEIEKEICEYFDGVDYSNYNIFIEFVKGSSLESLMLDAETVRRIFKK